MFHDRWSLEDEFIPRVVGAAAVEKTVVRGGRLTDFGSEVDISVSPSVYHSSSSRGSVCSLNLIYHMYK
jgi:hypothetical protein